MKRYGISGSKVAAAIVAATLIGIAGYYLVTTYSLSAGKTATVGGTSSSMQTQTPVCAREVGSSPRSFALQTSSSSPAFLCVQLYYYNQNTTLAINPASQIRIVGVHNGYVFDTSKTFAVTAEPPSVEIGGPSNMSEGVYVIYTITGSSNSDGKYTLNLGFLYPNAETCSSEFTLLSGSGVPEYRELGSCVLGLAGSGPVVLVEVVGMSNATGY